MHSLLGINTWQPRIVDIQRAVSSQPSIAGRIHDVKNTSPIVVPITFAQSLSSPTIATSLHRYIATKVCIH